MPLLGSAAMLLAFDLDAGATAEHDDWHTHEHLPERLAIPGFLRGTLARRWADMKALISRRFPPIAGRPLRQAPTPAS